MTEFGRSVTPETWNPDDHRNQLTDPSVVGSTQSAGAGTDDNPFAEGSESAQAFDAFWGRVSDSPRVQHSVERGQAGFSGPAATVVETRTDYSLESGGLEDSQGNTLHDNVTDTIPNPDDFDNPLVRIMFAVVAVLVAALILRPIFEIIANLTG